MKAKTLLGFVVVAIVTAAVVAGWRATQAARAAEAERLALIAGRATHDGAQRRLEERLVLVDKDRSDLQAALATARAAPKPAAPASPPAGPAKNPGSGMPNIAELIAQDPKLQVLELASRRAQLATTYGPFAVSRALTAEQLEKLLDAKMKAQEQMQDLMAIMRDQKLTPNDPAIAGLRKRAEDDMRVAQIAILGEAGHEEIQRYEQLTPARDMAERFAGAAAIGDVPLTLQQAEQLTQIMAANAGPQRDGRIDASRIDWATVDAKARDILSPAQFSLFQRIEPVGGGASRWMARLNRAMDEARQRSADAAPKPGG